MSEDPVVQELRAEISDLDRKLLATLNRRLEVVRQLHDHKQVTGMPLRDLEREVSLLRALEADNGGPLSAEGVASFFTDVLELTRFELYGE